RNDALAAALAGADVPARAARDHRVGMDHGHAARRAALRARHTVGLPAIPPVRPLSHPERLVDTGVYAWTRNPMYLGHVIYMIGVAFTFESWFAAVIAIARTVWFHFRVRRDERGLAARFGEPYIAYTRRVRRWLPGLF